MELNDLATEPFISWSTLSKAWEKSTSTRIVILPLSYLGWISSETLNTAALQLFPFWKPDWYGDNNFLSEICLSIWIDTSFSKVLESETECQLAYNL